MRERSGSVKSSRVRVGFKCERQLLIATLHRILLTGFLNRLPQIVTRPHSVHHRPDIAVGTLLSECPPHGSRRAELPHRALALREKGVSQCILTCEGFGARLHGLWQDRDEWILKGRCTMLWRTVIDVSRSCSMMMTEKRMRRNYSRKVTLAGDRCECATVEKNER